MSSDSRNPTFDSKTLLQAFMKRAEEKLSFPKDAISDVPIDLDTQSIYLETVGAGKKAAQDARQLAANLADVNCSTSCLVMADAGSGKSWMIYQIALELARRFSDGRSDCVPIIIPVQRLVGKMEGEIANQDAASVVTKYIHSGGSVMPDVVLGEKEREALIEALQSRRVVHLIDGVDEASEFSQDVEQFARKCAAAGNRVLVSSRPEGIAPRHSGRVVCEHHNGKFDIEYEGKGLETETLTERNVDKTRIKGRGEGNEGKLTAFKDGTALHAASYSVLFDDGSEEKTVHERRITNLNSKGKITGSVETYSTEFTIRYDDGVEEKGVEKGRISSVDGGFNLTMGDMVVVRNRPLAIGNRVQVEKPIKVHDKVEVEHARGGLFSSVKGWEVLGLPELSLQQQKQLVGAVLAKTVSSNGALGTFFDNVFHFVESRQTFDELFMELGEEDQKWLQSKMMEASPAKTHQVAVDGQCVDKGMLRKDLQVMFDSLEGLLLPMEGETEAGAKERAKELQQKWLQSEDLFLQQFGGKGRRVFELFKIAELANNQFQAILKSTCSRAQGSIFEKTRKRILKQAGVSFLTCDLKGIQRSLEKV
jgi:hypothetical protein